jgi:hypothetical protein
MLDYTPIPLHYTTSLPPRLEETRIQKYKNRGVDAIKKPSQSWEGF